MKRIISIICSIALFSSCLVFAAFAIVAEPPVYEVNTQSRSENFNSNYTLVGNGAADIVAIALAQEGRTGSQFGYTEEWCADFVCDCALLAGQRAAVPLYGGVEGLKTRVINAGGTVTTSSPKVGDLCFIDWNGNGGYGHVEIVYAVSGNKISTIGGNSGDGSTLYTRYVRKHNPLSSSYITCIVRPNYINSGEHTCNKGEYMWYLDVHPHYSCYKCSICGKIWTDESSSNKVNICNSCRPGKPVTQVSKDCIEGKPVTVSWNATDNTTHYNLWIDKKNAAGDWSKYENIF